MCCCLVTSSLMRLRKIMWPLKPQTVLLQANLHYLLFKESVLQGLEIRSWLRFIKYDFILLQGRFRVKLTMCVL